MASSALTSATGLLDLSDDACGSWETPLRERLQQLIHDQVLQELGVSLLQTELCRRLFERGQGEQAVEELKGVGQQIEAAVAVLRQIMSDLGRATAGHPGQA